MIVAEEEAKTKRCQESFPAAEALSPQGHVEAGSMPVQHITYPFGSDGPAYASAATATFARHTAPTHCIGSACMAWRWAEKHWTDRLTMHVRSQDPDRPSGYCGKAGRP